MKQPYDAVLLDAGTGNLHSVHNALKSLGVRILISSLPDDVLTSSRIILPGVGAFGSFMTGLEVKGLMDAILSAVQRSIPMLGICVGMQALFECSEEKGIFPGLALLAGKVKRFPELKGIKVPHTGWNQLWVQKNSRLFRGVSNGDYAYFNHSYYCAPRDAGDLCAITDYGMPFASAVQHENLFGVQFHPEKSQHLGRKILENFCKV